MIGCFKYPIIYFYLFFACKHHIPLSVSGIITQFREIQFDFLEKENGILRHIHTLPWKLRGVYQQNKHALNL